MKNGGGYQAQWLVPATLEPERLRLEDPGLHSESEVSLVVQQYFDSSKLKANQPTSQLKTPEQA